MADLAETDHFNLVKHGSVRLALRFAEATPHTVSVIAYAEFDNLLTEIYSWTLAFENERRANRTTTAQH